MPEFLGCPGELGMFPRGKENSAVAGEGLGLVPWVWAGSRVGSSSLGPGVSSAPGRGGSDVWGWRKGWPELILVVFGEELGLGHGIAQMKILHEVLQVPRAWGERKRG